MICGKCQNFKTPYKGSKYNGTCQATKKNHTKLDECNVKSVIIYSYKLKVPVVHKFEDIIDDYNFSEGNGFFHEDVFYSIYEGYGTKVLDNGAILAYGHEEIVIIFPDGSVHHEYTR